MEIVAWRKEATAGNGGGEWGERTGGARWDLPLSLPSTRPQELQTTLGMGRCPLTPPQAPPAGCDWHLKTAISLPRGPKKQLLIKLIQRNRAMGSGPGEKSPRSMALAGDSIALFFLGSLRSDFKDIVDSACLSPSLLAREAPPSHPRTGRDGRA